jgi:3-methyladenine DNA glycosylase AlkD
MDVAAVLATLAAAGAEATRKTYRRHGAPEPLFGVPFGALRDLAKRLGTDHALAQALWDSGNTDARALAALIADPRALDADLADRWAGGLRYHVVVDLVAAWSRARRWPSSAWRSGSAATTSSSRAAAGR